MERTEIEKALVDAGWSISSKLKKDGGYQDSSTWEVTVSKGKRSFTTDFHRGSAFRAWSKNSTYQGSWTKQDEDCLGASPKPGRKVQRVPSRVSIYHESLLSTTVPIPPEMVDVIRCLTSEASLVRHGQDFEEFCSDLGYDTDSRKDFDTFTEVTETWRKMAGLGADFDTLDQLFQDY